MTHPSFPGVELVVHPPPGEEVRSVRFALWITVLSTRSMLIEQNYSGEFRTLYRGEEVGSMAFLPIRSTDLISKSSDLGTEQTQLYSPGFSSRQ